MAKAAIDTALFARRLGEAMDAAGYNTYSLGDLLSLTPSTISRYANGLMNPKMPTLHAMAGILGVSADWLMGQDSPREAQGRALVLDNIFTIQTRRLPLLGTIAAGHPIWADEQFEDFETIVGGEQADFVLRVKGDSMIGARIHDGDLVFIRKQDTVEQNEIAAVLIEDEATLKRFRRYDNVMILSAENPAFDDIVIRVDESTQVRILGKAIAFQSSLR